MEEQRSITGRIRDFSPVHNVHPPTELSTRDVKLISPLHPVPKVTIENLYLHFSYAFLGAVHHYTYK
jgi:hypothetical protein